MRRIPSGTFTLFSRGTMTLALLFLLAEGIGVSGTAHAATMSHLEQHLRNLGIFETAVSDLAAAVGISRDSAASAVGVRGFVDAIYHSSQFDPAIDNRVALAIEETAALLLIASKRTSMTFGQQMIRDLYQGEVVVYQDLAELRRVCADPYSYGCNRGPGLGGGSRSRIVLYGYPSEPASVAMEKYRGEMIHELMHNHQGSATDPQRCLSGHTTLLPSQFGTPKCFQDSVDENKACYDTVANLMYRGRVPYGIVDLKLCRSSR